jgi:hypothetical protein
MHRNLGQITYIENGEYSSRDFQFTGYIHFPRYLVQNTKKILEKHPLNSSNVRYIVHKAYFGIQ